VNKKKGQELEGGTLLNQKKKKDWGGGPSDCTHSHWNNEKRKWLAAAVRHVSPRTKKEQDGWNMFQRQKKGCQAK